MFAAGREGFPPGRRVVQGALAIRAQIPISTLLDQVAQYPTYSEAYLVALEQLAL